MTTLRDQDILVATIGNGVGIDPAEMLPKLVPESKDERIQIVDAALADAGLPRYSQISAFEPVIDDEDDIGPIFKSSFGDE